MFDIRASVVSQPGVVDPARSAAARAALGGRTLWSQPRFVAGGPAGGGAPMPVLDLCEEPPSVPGASGPVGPEPARARFEREARADDVIAAMQLGVDPGVLLPHVLPARVSGAAPGVELAEMLDAFDPSELSAFELVEAAAAWQRVQSWASARQAAALAELTRREQLSPTPSGEPFGSVNVVNSTAQALTEPIALTFAQAQNQVGRSRQLVQSFPAVHAALAEGRLDDRRVRIILDELAAHSPDVRRAVEAEILPHVHQWDSTVLRRAIRRVLHRLAPTDMAARSDAAARERYVKLTPVEDGMAYLDAYLRAEDAVAVKNALDAAAVTLQRHDRTSGAGNVRTRDQARADALAAIGWEALRTGHLSGCGRLATAQGRPVTVGVVVPLATLAGLDDGPAELSGYGPVSAPVARRLATEATWRRLLTDPAGTLVDHGRARYEPSADLVDFVIARDRECRAPGCHRPASTCEIDHTTPYPQGPTAAANLGALCPTHHRLKHHTGWSVQQTRPGVFVWTAPTGHRSTVRPPPF